MAVERTLSIVKPDAVGKNVLGEIYSRFESNGLRLVAVRMVRLSEEVAGGFYAEHRERPTACVEGTLMSRRVDPAGKSTDHGNTSFCQRVRETIGLP